jgi:Cu/Ag efflux pump CusA
MLLSFYIRALWDETHPFVESTILGSGRRFRAMMMTATVDGSGLLRAAISTKIGSRKPNDRWRLSQSADALRSRS